MAVYFAMLKPGDTIMGMDLSHGGHLTHGHPLSYSGRDFKVVAYGVRREDERIDYDQMQKLAEEQAEADHLRRVGLLARDRLQAHPGDRRFKVGALMMADIAHIAGLVVAGEHPSPGPVRRLRHDHHAQDATRPASGLVLCREKYAKDLDRAVFPGMQGGPLVHVIAAKAVAFRRRFATSSRSTRDRSSENAKVLCRDGRRGRLSDRLRRDRQSPLPRPTSSRRESPGRTAEKMLEAANITVNKNTIPFDQNKPMVASGCASGRSSCAACRRPSS
jgi:glycine hydroxymethyltransferase